jgi:hypothetical protein
MSDVSRELPHCGAAAARVDSFDEMRFRSDRLGHTTSRLHYAAHFADCRCDIVLQAFGVPYAIERYGRGTRNVRLVGISMTMYALRAGM